MNKPNLKIMFVLFIIMIFQLACNTTTETSPANMAKVFQIHLQSGFAQTPVTITIDNSQIFSDIISTSALSGVAAIVPAQVTNGTHFLRVTVSNSVSKDTTFTIQDTLYIGVNYSSQNSQINYYFTRKGFLYD
jgi:hypothetical protein